MEQQSRPKWTEAQQKAISCRGGTVLVSAAAGSGKTAVLVQRVIDILTDRQNPVDANCILVVTFSNAAAEEMRPRISGCHQKRQSDHRNAGNRKHHCRQFAA